MLSQFALRLPRLGKLCQGWLAVSARTLSKKSTEFDIGPNVSEKDVVVQGNLFNQPGLDKRTREAFQDAVSTYCIKYKNRRGHVEFIYAALKRMKEYGVHRDREVYRALLDVFPQGPMRAQTIWQVELMNYPKQQQCVIDLLEQMEDNAVIPDEDMGRVIRRIFGKWSHAERRFMRMIYWMPKFRHANPYPVPLDPVKDKIELAKVALRRMAVDLQNELSVYNADKIDFTEDNSWIVSAQSPLQRALIETHPEKEPLYVEGPFLAYIREQIVDYFILKADPTADLRERKDAYDKFMNSDDDLFNWDIFSQKKSPYSLLVPPSVHEQDDGTIVGMGITETGTKESLKAWIKHLQDYNHKLSKIPVVFKITDPEVRMKAFEEATSRGSQ